MALAELLASFALLLPGAQADSQLNPVVDVEQPTASVTQGVKLNLKSQLGVDNANKIVVPNFERTGYDVSSVVDKDKVGLGAPDLQQGQQLWYECGDDILPEGEGIDTRGYYLRLAGNNNTELARKYWLNNIGKDESNCVLPTATATATAQVQEAPTPAPVVTQISNSVPAAPVSIPVAATPGPSQPQENANSNYPNAELYAPLGQPTAIAAEPQRMAVYSSKAADSGNPWEVENVDLIRKGNLGETREPTMLGKCPGKILGVLGKGWMEASELVEVPNLFGKGTHEEIRNYCQGIIPPLYDVTCRRRKGVLVIPSPLYNSGVIAIDLGDHKTIRNGSPNCDPLNKR